MMPFALSDIAVFDYCLELKKASTQKLVIELKEYYTMDPGHFDRDDLLLLDLIKYELATRN